MNDANDVTDHRRHCDAAEAEIARFVEVAGQADGTTPVPTCPGWTVADLVRHLGIVYRWMTLIVRTRPPERPSPDDPRFDEPAGDGDSLGWLAAGAEPLMTALRAARGDEP